MKKEEGLFCNRKGQFYLMVSLILVAVIVGMISVHNLAKKKPVAKISHLEEELEIESEYVLDYYTNTDDYVIDDFTKNYSYYLGGDVNVIYILENESDGLEVFDYNLSTGNKNTRDYYVLDYVPSSGEGKINVPVNSTNYTFEMRHGKDFYFIITKEAFEEKHVITNQK